jgi:hypothetical protein
MTIDAFCDSVPAHTSIQALGLLRNMATTEVICDTGNVKVFCRMVQQNVNIRRIDMSRMTDVIDMKSLTNEIMMDASRSMETIPNLDAKFSFLPYKFCADGPGPDKAQLYSCMKFFQGGKIYKKLTVPFWAGQITKEDIAKFMKLLKLKGQADGPLQAIQLFLQKYSTMREDRDGWDRLAEDVDYVVSIDKLSTYDVQWKLAEYVQVEMDMGVMTTNGQPNTVKGILVGEILVETNDTAYEHEPRELQQQDVSKQLNLPLGSILYEPVTINIHYPKNNNWTQEVIEDLESYSADDEKQGELQVMRTWKDLVQKAIAVLTKEENVGMLNWDENHYLRNIKMFPLVWRKLVRDVYKNICYVSPARYYVLTTTLSTRKQICNAYWQVPLIVDKYIEDIFSTELLMQKLGKKTMNLDKPAHCEYPEIMMPVVRHPYYEGSKSFNSQNITYYLQLIMCCCYNIDTKNDIDSLSSEAANCAIRASRREYLPARNLFDNELPVVSISCSAVSLATAYSTFLGKTCNGVYSLIQVNNADKTFYRNMMLFRFTGQLLERANAKGVNPVFEGGPECFVFLRRTSTGMVMFSCS